MILKRNKELVTHVKTWRNLKNFMLTERSQTQKATYMFNSLIGLSGKGKTIGAKIRSVVVTE